MTSVADLSRPARAGRSGNLILAVMSGVVAMTVIDLAVVNVALPSIQAQLRVPAADLQWVVVAYSVAVAGLLLLGGRAGDLLGHRRALLAGVAVLVAASLAAGLAHALPQLVAARAGQGVGAALAAPNALGILTRTFAEGRDRNRALGIVGAAAGTSAIAGSVAGGILVQSLGWPWVFLINVPAGVILIAAILAVVPGDVARPGRARPDLAGAVTLTAGLTAIAFGVHESTAAGWLAAPTLLTLGGGAAALAAFGLAEKRAQAPLIPLATLARHSLAWASTSAGLQWASFLGLIYAATLFVQEALHWSPLAAGASTIPIAVLSLLASGALAPRLAGRIGAPATLALGLALQGGGIALLARVHPPASYLTGIAPAYAVVGLGLGLAEVTGQIAAFSGIDPSEAGLAGGALETAREMGGAIGLSLIVSLAAVSGASVAGAFHRSVILSAALAGAGMLAALVLLRGPAAGRPGAVPAASQLPAGAADDQLIPTTGAACPVATEMQHD